VAGVPTARSVLLFLLRRERYRKGLSPRPFATLRNDTCCFVVMELRVGNKYRLGRKIGSGSFGDIYLGLYGVSFFARLLRFGALGHVNCAGVST